MPVPPQTQTPPDLSRMQRRAQQKNLHGGVSRRKTSQGNGEPQLRRLHLLRTTLVAFAILCVVAALAVIAVFFMWPNSSRLAQGTQVDFVIAPGTNSTQIAADLKHAGLIGNETIFRFRLQRLGAGSNLIAGTHLLVSGWSYERIILALSSSPTSTAVKVVIPEGSNIARIATILHDRLGLSAAAFEAYATTAASDFKQQYPYLESAYNGSLEGYLFPDTYQFPKSSTPQEICAEMLGRFDQVWAGLQPSGHSNYSIAQLVTVASLVEKEVSVPTERPLVASVIYNRLDRNMRLQLCSTVQILLPDPAKNKLRLTAVDLATPSPYNTYLHAGLPPGPIANPGKAALEAALKPAQTSYLYFVLTGKDGSQTFASTSAEFETAKLKSKEVFGQ